MSDQPNATPSASPAVALDPAMRQLVAQAQADLAGRRGVDAGAVEVVEARAVTWPDPSLGCPQPGMAYKQVPVDGVLIQLKVGATIFSYHGGGGRAPFLCEHPARPIAPGADTGQ